MTPEAVTLQVASGVTALVKGKPVTEIQMPTNVAPESGDIGRRNDIGESLSVPIGADYACGTGSARRASTSTGCAGIPQTRNGAWRPRSSRTQPVPKMRIQNIIGQTVEMANPGAAAFTVGGRPYQLEALLESADANELFFMFRDGTSGKATYGAGRYLYTPLPKDGRVTLDFNLATNPPCAFTEFATCPLPPPKNRLLIPLEAGELDYLH